MNVIFFSLYAFDDKSIAKDFHNFSFTRLPKSLNATVMRFIPNWIDPIYLIAPHLSVSWILKNERINVCISCFFFLFGLDMDVEQLIEKKRHIFDTLCFEMTISIRYGVFSLEQAINQNRILNRSQNTLCSVDFIYFVCIFCALCILHTFLRVCRVRFSIKCTTKERKWEIS